MKVRRRVTECDARASHQVGLRRYDVVTAQRITSGGFVTTGSNQEEVNRLLPVRDCSAN